MSQIAEADKYSNLNKTVMNMLNKPSFGWWAIFIFDMIFLAFGIYCFIYQVYTGLGVAGYSHPVLWGVYITDFVFGVGIAHSGTLSSAVLFLFRAKFRMSIYRIAEAMTVFAVATAGLFPIIHLGRPWNFYWLLPYPNQRGLWVNFDSPLLWDVFAVSTYATISSVFFFIGMIPDIAAIRDTVVGKAKKALYSVLSLGWKGSNWEWSTYTRAYFYFACFATPLVISVHSVVSWDFAMANTPGWHTTIFPPYFVAGAIFSGLAMVITLCIPLRLIFKLEDYITMENFEGMSKMIILTSCIVFYAYLIEFFIAWYSQVPEEGFVFLNRAVGPYAWAYWTMITCNVISPQLFWFKKIRTNIVALFILSIFINIGMWFERFVIVITSLHRDYLPSSWDMYYPTFWDISLFLGSFGLFFTLFFLFIKFVPIVSIAEIKAVLPNAHPHIDEEHSNE